MFIVGITGGIATGKSTIAEVFREHGIPVIDADIMARKVVEPGQKAYKLIKEAFGESVFKNTGELDREALSELVFQDTDKRRKLNEITHPEIYREMFWAAVCCFFQGHQFVVMDLPLLFESGSMLGYLHKIIVITCEEDLQLQRLMDRSNVSEHRAKLRIGAQMSLESKCERAHFVVENSGSQEDTKHQVERIISILKRSRHHWKLRLIAGLVTSGLVSLLIWLGARYLQSSNRLASR